MFVKYQVRRGGRLHLETEEYANLEAALRGIENRITDPFSPKVVEVLSIRDRQGCPYELEWSAILVPKRVVTQAA